MIEAEQLKYKLNSFQEPLEDLSGSLALEAKKERIDQLELNMEEPGFWDNVEESQNVMKEVKSLKGVVEEYDDLKTKYESSKICSFEKTCPLFLARNSQISYSAFVRGSFLLSTNSFF